MNLAELQETMNEIKSHKGNMEELVRQGVSFEMARVLLVNRSKITMGEATDRLTALENITRVKLER